MNRGPGSCPICGYNRLTKDTTFLQFAGAFTDLEPVVIDLDLVAALLEIAVLLPGKLYRFGFAGFEVYRYFGGVDLIAFVTGSEIAGTQCGYTDGLAIGAGDANIYIGLAGLCDTVGDVKTNNQLVYLTGGSSFFIFSVTFFMHRGDRNIGCIQRGSYVDFLFQVLLGGRSGSQVVGELFLVSSERCLFSCQLLIVLGQLSHLLFEVTDLIVQFLDQVFSFFLFCFCKMLFVQQAANIAFQFGYLAIAFVKLAGQLVIGSG